MELLLREGAVEVLLVVVAVLVALTMILAVLILSKLKRFAALEPLTREVIGQLLRAESDLIRRAGDEQARGLRDELADRVRDFQDNTTRTFTALFEGVNAQMRAFGDRLDGGVNDALGAG